MAEFSITALYRGKLYEAIGLVTFRGESVIITRRGQPIAKIVPIDRTEVVSDPAASIATKSIPAEKSLAKTPPKK